MVKRLVLWIAMAMAIGLTQRMAAAEETVLRVGIIGLDTSHSPAFAKAINGAAEGDMARCRVVAAYPHGSATIESSASRVPMYTQQFRDLGVEVTDSIAALLSKVDCVLLETNDGRLHLEQAIEVFRAGKPVFIDKPLGSNLTEVVAIVRAAEAFNVPMFSSSSLRYAAAAQAARAGQFGRVLGCDSYSPCSLEPTHVDLFWYGIHGVELLYTCLGPGCETVTHTSTEGFEFAVGKWADGRIGSFRGIREGAKGYGATVFAEKSIEAVTRNEGYGPLVEQIATFFVSREVPIDAAETIELYAFMQAAAESKQRGGQPVAIAEVLRTAEAEAKRQLSTLIKQGG